MPPDFNPVAEAVGISIMLFVEIAGGLVLLVTGGDALVRGAVSLAARFGVSPLFIGLTLVGFGTSTPELVVSVNAALIGAPGIAVGNVIGSNIANILLILGLAALIRPLATSREALKRDGTMLAVASILCVAIVLFGFLDRVWGIAFVTLLAGYIIYIYWRERRVHDASAAMHEAEAAAAPKGPSTLWLTILITIGGVAGIAIGAQLLVGGAVGLASVAGISESVVGLTIVSVGTSLPELITSVMAAFRRQADVAFGNVVGSNIFNILGILGVTALVQPIQVPPQISSFDIWVMSAATMLLIIFSMSGWRLNRIEGGLMLACYAGYTAWLVAAVG